jgi:hypothetical protein
MVCITTYLWFLSVIETHWKLKKTLFEANYPKNFGIKNLSKYTSKRRKMSHDEQNRSEAQHGNKDQFMNLCPILGLIL